MSAPSPSSLLASPTLRPGVASWGHAESVAHAQGARSPTRKKNFSAKEAMRRGVPQAPSRKRKLGGRDKGGLDVSAVNSSFLKYSFPYVWAVLTLREMVRSGSRPGQVRAADLMSPLWGGERRGGFRKVLEKNKTVTAARPKW